MKILKTLPASISKESKDNKANYHLTKINFPPELWECKKETVAQLIKLE